jgi:hypothetical protein
VRNKASTAIRILTGVGLFFAGTTVAAAQAAGAASPLPARGIPQIDHYVFRKNGDPAEHLPEHSRGILGQSTSELRGLIRQFLIQKLTGR